MTTVKFSYRIKILTINLSNGIIDHYSYNKEQNMSNHPSSSLRLMHNWARMTLISFLLTGMLLFLSNQVPINISPQYELIVLHCMLFGLAFTFPSWTTLTFIIIWLVNMLDKNETKLREKIVLSSQSLYEKYRIWKILITFLFIWLTIEFSYLRYTMLMHH